MHAIYKSKRRSSDLGGPIPSDPIPSTTSASWLPTGPWCTNQHGTRGPGPQGHWWPLKMVCCCCFHILFSAFNSSWIKGVLEMVKVWCHFMKYPSSLKHIPMIPP